MYVPDADGNDVLESYKITFTYTPSEGDPVVSATTYTVGKDNASPAKPIELTNNSASITVSPTENKTALIVNKKLGILPSTGGSGIYFYIVVGGAIAGAAAYFICKTKKEEKQLS